MASRIFLLFFCVNTCSITPAVECKVKVAFTGIAELIRACPCPLCLGKQSHPYTDKEHCILEPLRDALQSDDIIRLVLGYCNQRDFGHEWVEIAGKKFTMGISIPDQKKSHLIIFPKCPDICLPPELAFESTHRALVLESKDILSPCRQYKATITPATIAEEHYEICHGWRIDSRPRYIKYHYALPTLPHIMALIAQHAAKKP